MTSRATAPRRRLVVLGGSLHHRGGLEAYCERAADAITRRASSWEAEWWPTETAYFSPRRAAGIWRVRQRTGHLDGVDLVWLQWSTLLDLLFVHRLHSQGVPVLVTPHLGAGARLQRRRTLRRLSARLLAGADRLGLLFDEQAGEITLPPALPRSIVGTFLSEAALTARLVEKRDGPLHLIHAGRLSAEKGSFRMIELCAMLRARQVPFTAQIVGRAEPTVTAALNAAIMVAGLGESLRLEGWMDGIALGEALARSDVLVHLSELDSFPLIVLEALAAGTMPIVVDMAGAASMVRRYGGLVTSRRSVEAAANWLAAQDLATLRHDALAAAEHVRYDHDWGRIVAKLEDVFALT